MNFNVNFNAIFNNFLEQSSCAFSWRNKRHDNIKMHGRTVKKDHVKLCCFFHILLFLLCLIVYMVVCCCMFSMFLFNFVYYIFFLLCLCILIVIYVPF